MLAVPLVVIGCSKEEVKVQDISQMETTEKETSLLSKLSGKERYKEIKIKIPKNLKRVEVKDDMLLYAIDDSKRSVGVSSDYIGEQNLDEYIEKVKSVLGEVIDLKDSIQGSIEIDEGEARTLEYKYLLNGTCHVIYQICFKYEDLAYILTLWSDEENVDEDKEMINQMFQSVFS